MISYDKKTNLFTIYAMSLKLRSRKLRESIGHEITGHLRNRLIGGTYHIFLAYAREYPHKILALYGTIPPF